MTARPLLVVFRSTCAATVFAVAGGLVGCADPAPAPPSTLDSPRAVVATRICLSNDDGQIAFSPPETCLDAQGAVREGDLRARAVVANAGDGLLHVVELDGTAPVIVDFDASVPGITGVRASGRPQTLSALDGFPGLIAVGTSEPPSLVIFDAAQGKRVDIVGNGQQFGLPTVPIALHAPAGTQRLVWAEPDRNAVASARMVVSCGGELGRHATGCALSVALEDVQRVYVDAPPVWVHIASDGVAWITRRGHSSVIQAALVEPALAEHCNGQPCVLQTLSVGQQCADGLDNDFDGLFDAADPQCFGPDDREDGTLRDGSVSTCTNGLDDDNDGLIDALDPECTGRLDQSERATIAVPPCDDGIDNDLDGLIDVADPGCEASSGESEFAGFVPLPAAAARTAPACSNGLDDDGDGAIDWPADADCYGPWGTTESAPVRIQTSRVVSFAEGDLVAVLDESTPQVLFFDARSNALVEVHADVPLRQTSGVALPGGFPTAMLVDSVVLPSLPLAQSGRLQPSARYVHVPVSGGVVQTIEVDRRLDQLDAAGTVVRSWIEDRFRRRDLSATSGGVRSVTCRIPTSLLDELGESVQECEDPRLPRPAIVDRTVLDVDNAAYSLQDGNAYASIPQEVVVEVDATTRLPTSVVRPFDYAIANDRWQVVWEGLLPNTDRQDVLVADDEGTLVILGASPCEAGRDVCSLGLDFSECPEARALCAAGRDLCEGAPRLCDVCPAACARPVDLCSAGVVPGDRVVLRRLDSVSGLPAACTPFARRPDGPEGVVELRRIEYRVLDVDQGRLRIGPLAPSEATDRIVALDLPPAACFRKPAGIEVRAGESWMLRGAQVYGHPSPNVSLQGVCVPREESARFNGRPRFDVPFRSWADILLEVTPGERTPVRDFTLEYDVRSGFVDRAPNLFELVVGLTTSDGAGVRTRVGPRLVFVDESLNSLWVYSATAFGTGRLVR